MKLHEKLPYQQLLPPVRRRLSGLRGSWQKATGRSRGEWICCMSHESCGWMLPSSSRWVKQNALLHGAVADVSHAMARSNDELCEDDRSAAARWKRKACQQPADACPDPLKALTSGFVYAVDKVTVLPMSMARLYSIRLPPCS